jgi:Lon-like protease
LRPDGAERSDGRFPDECVCVRRCGGLDCVQDCRVGLIGSFLPPLTQRPDGVLDEICVRSHDEAEDHSIDRVIGIVEVGGRSDGSPLDGRRRVSQERDELRRGQRPEPLEGTNDSCPNECVAVVAVGHYGLVIAAVAGDHNRSPPFRGGELLGFSHSATVPTLLASRWDTRGVQNRFLKGRRQAGRGEPPTVQLLGMNEQANEFIRRRDRRKVLLALAIAVVWVALGLIRVGSYVIMKPGSADDVDARLDISGVPAFAPRGKTYWATVGIIDRPAPIQMLWAWLSGEQDVPKRRDVYGDETPKESLETSKVLMEGSKQVSEIVAARKLGYRVTGGGAELADVDPTYPASKVLKVGDVITQIGSTPICIQADIGEALRGVKPGSMVDVTVQRGKSSLTLATPTAAVAGVTRPVFGVVLTAETKNPCRTPFTVKIQTESIGGPSAGLAMTIALLERLTPGELTGGQRVAVTGTIEGDERVGEVGGVKQKTLAVKAAGAKLFIVPKSEVDLARPHAGSMRVVGVDTLDEALAALRAVGGDPLPSPRG